MMFKWNDNLVMDVRSNFVKCNIHCFFFLVIIYCCNKLSMYMSYLCLFFFFLQK